MSGDVALVQHRLETIAHRLKQLRSGTTAAALHLEYMLEWCDDMVAAAESGTNEPFLHALSNTRAAVIAAQIDLKAADHAIDTAQLRAAHTVRFVPGFTTSGR